MAEINNLKELNKLGRDLKVEDYIYFKTKIETLEYDVGITCMACYNSDANGQIFKYFNLNAQEKYRLASKCYGYKVNSGGWPWYKEADFKALERLIREIYKLLKDESIIDPKERINSRFDILDIRD